MTTEAPDQILTRLRTLGTFEWWIAYVGGPLLLFGAGLALFPGLIYDRFVWQYLWGPVVADAVGHPVTFHGIRAVKGYNLVNTITYVTIALYALPGVRAFFKTFDIDLNIRLAYGLAPILVAGGVMRALEDATLLPIPLDRLFITPSIYFVISGITLVTLGVGVWIRDRAGVPDAIPFSVAGVGTVWSLAGFTIAGSYALRPTTSVHPSVPLLTVGGASLFVVGAYLVGTYRDRPELGHPLVLLLVFGQLLDATQNLLGVGWYGYTPKLFVTRHIYEMTGFVGSTFLLKFGAVLAIVWLVASNDDPVDAPWNWLVLVAATAVGLPQGVRGALRITLGV